MRKNKLLILGPEFFGRPVLDVARELIGCYLVCRRDGKTDHFLITETEAYDGEKDLACHASRGRTARTEVLFGPPGRIYIYFTYGMHWLLNFVACPEGYPAGVLIRGITDKNGRATVGPARITKKLGLDGSLHGKAAVRANGLWVEQGGNVDPKRIRKLPRVGVEYAGPVWAMKKWRFQLK